MQNGSEELIEITEVTEVGMNEDFIETEDLTETEDK